MQEFDEGDRNKMLEELRVLSVKLRRPLLAADVADARKRGEVAPINHYLKAFDTIPTAIKLAGVAPKRVYTRAELIEHLQRVDAEFDRPVGAHDLNELYDKRMGPNRHQYERMFGSIRLARRAAKVKNVYRTAVGSGKYWQRYTVDEIIAQLQDLGKKLGHRPTDRDLNAASGDYSFACGSTVARMFGGLPNAHRAAGFELKRNRRHFDADIIAAVKKLAKKLGRFPKYRDIDAASRAGKCPALNTIKLRFGSLEDLRTKIEPI